MNKLAVIVGIIIILVIGVWAFINLQPLFAGLFGGTQGSVTVNNQTFKVSVADTPKEQEKGLSGRHSLPQDQGMLFVFAKADYPSFWMKDMQFPLDIIFIADHTVTTVYQNVPPPDDENTPLPLYKPTAPSDKVLEINGGQAAQYGIKPGSTVQIDLKK